MSKEKNKFVKAKKSILTGRIDFFTSQITYMASTWNGLKALKKADLKSKFFYL